MIADLIIALLQLTLHWEGGEEALVCGEKTVEHRGKLLGGLCLCAYGEDLPYKSHSDTL